MAIRIVTDSSADLPMDLSQYLDITVVPCYVVIDGVTYRDGVATWEGEEIGAMDPIPEIEGPKRDRD